MSITTVFLSPAVSRNEEVGLGSMLVRFVAGKNLDQYLRT
jgi:hypothetical protein